MRKLSLSDRPIFLNQKPETTVATVGGLGSLFWQKLLFSLFFTLSCMMFWLVLRHSLITTLALLRLLNDGRFWGRWETAGVWVLQGHNHLCYQAVVVEGFWPTIYQRWAKTTYSPVFFFGHLIYFLCIMETKIIGFREREWKRGDISCCMLETWKCMRGKQCPKYPSIFGWGGLHPTDCYSI